MKVNIKTSHVTYGISHDFNFEVYNISKFYRDQSLKVTILY